MSLTKKEMVEAMMEGKRLIDIDEDEMFYDPDHVDGPFVYKKFLGGTATVYLSWNNSKWEIKSEKIPLDKVIGPFKEFKKAVDKFEEACESMLPEKLEDK